MRDKAAHDWATRHQEGSGIPQGLKPLSFSRPLMAALTPRPFKTRVYGEKGLSGRSDTGSLGVLRLRGALCAALRSG